MSPLGYRVAYG